MPEIEDLDLGYLAYFTGLAMNERVLEALHAAGHPRVRTSHGFVIQHLIEAPRTVGELARRLEVTQQAASKAVAELVSLGYLEPAPSGDARQRRVRLSPSGLAMVQATRRIRRSLERRLLRRQRAADVATARRVLAQALESLGGAEMVRRRRVREQ